MYTKLGEESMEGFIDVFWHCIAAVIAVVIAAIAAAAVSTPD